MNFFRILFDFSIIFVLNFVRVNALILDDFPIIVLSSTWKRKRSVTDVITAVIKPPINIGPKISGMMKVLGKISGYILNVLKINKSITKIEKRDMNSALLR